jgi:O-antigen/teichoic acid export membrane protein
MGQFALVLSVSDAVGALTELGIGQTALRYASRAVARGGIEEQYAIMRWAFRVRVALVVLLSLFVVIGAPLLADKIWEDPGLTPLLRIAMVLPLLGVLAYVPVLYFQSLKRFGMNAAVLTGQSFLSLIGVIVIALLSAWSVSIVVLVSVFSSAAGAVVFLWLVPKRALHDPDRRDERGWTHGRFWKVPVVDAQLDNGIDDVGANRFAFYMLISKIIMLLSLRVDVWIMGVYLDQSQIGLYNVASRFVLPLSFVLISVNSALLPRSAAVTGRDELKTMLKKTFHASGLVAVATVFYALLVPYITPWVFGAVYEPSVGLAQVLSLGYCAAIAAAPIGLIGYNLGLARNYWVVNLLQLTIVILILVLYLPVIGPLAGAVAFLASAVVGALLTGFLVLRKARILDHIAENP